MTESREGFVPPDGADPKPTPTPVTPGAPVTGWGQPNPPQPYPQQYPAQQYPAQQYPQQQHPQPQQYPNQQPRENYGYALQLGNKPGVIPLRPLTLGELFDGAFQTMRRHPAAILGSSAIVATVMALAQAALMAVLTLGFINVLGPSLDNPDVAPSEADLLSAFATSGIGFLLLGAVIIIAQALLSGVLVVPTGKATTGQSIAFGQVWRAAFARIVPLVLWPLLLMAVQFGAFSALFGTVIALGTLLSGWFFLLLLLSVPAYFALLIWIYGRLSFVPAVIMLEKASLPTSIRRSRDLTMGTFWRVFGILLLGSIVAGLCATILATPASLISSVIGAASPTDVRAAMGATGAQLVVTAVGQIVAWTISLPFTGVLATLLYTDVRMRREGLDVQLARAASEGRR